MKVLFAVSNEEISESIVKKYQKQYKQIISYKNVYYFNAILKEIQKDKSYDRIVISEELEAFTHTQYDQIDKFIFEKLDGISDEAASSTGKDIPIILICSDRRTKSEEMLVKLFGIGIYNAIIGSDRSVEEVCRLINRPRTKKEAKTYYQIESESVNYQSENENDVSEVEIQNILAHYKRLGKNEDRYLESFDNIAAQYNDTQLRIISKFLPLNVRAVLEERSPKYQQVMSFNSKVSDKLRKPKKEEVDGTSEQLLKPKTKEQIMSGPVVIPSSVNMNGARKLSRTRKTEVTKMEEPQAEIPLQEPVQEQVKEPVQVEPVKESAEQPAKRRRGRPRKNPEPVVEESVEQPVKRRRGRPRKNPLPEEIQEEKLEEQTEEQLQQEKTDVDLELKSEEFESVLPGLEENDEVNITNNLDSNYRNNNYNNENNNYNSYSSNYNNNEYNYNQYSNNNSANFEESVLPGLSSNVSYGQPIATMQENSSVNDNEIEKIDLSGLLTSGKKIATFVGTSKNGTSFIVNNLAEMLSTAGIDVAILDTTKNRNSYYIYTKNEEELRNIAEQTITGLARGIARGIEVHKNLTVYTSLPDENEAIEHTDKILETLLGKHSLILIDTDFKTPSRYFEQAQEIYLIQSLDVLTIQPLTAFLRELKSKNILEDRKLRVVLNKTVKIRGINDKTIIGGMAFYNDPAMSFMTELFDRTLIKYMSIPFEEETYIKYLENVIECNVSLKGYSKGLLQSLKELGNMVYPTGGTSYRPPTANGYNTQNTFSPGMTQTLNQMKNNY
mgnify:FL=1